MTYLRLLWALPFVLLVVGAFAPPRAAAGDAQLAVMLVNMTPEPTDAGRRCFGQVRAALAAEYTIIRRLGETAVRERAGNPSGPMLDWDHAALSRVAPGDQNATVLVDCRPDERSADVLVYNPARDISQLRLRGVRIDRPRARWLAGAILRHGWVGLIP